jgi:hypothetical protein
VDFFEVDQPDEIRRLGFEERPQGGTAEKLTLLAESGYLLLVKSFRDDLAWEVQRHLVQHYFRSRSIALPDTQLERCTQLLKELVCSEPHRAG